MSDLGRDYETSLDPHRRRRDGVHYTPRRVADSLIDLAFAAHASSIASDERFLICDPTCGAGVFLLAAADAMVVAGRTPIEALACLRGMDIDPAALDVARAELTAWARKHGVEGDPPFVLAVGDALNDPWPDDRALDVVIGNPPFGGQVSGSTVRSEAAVAGAARILGRPAGYTDTAGVLLVRALDAVRPGGSVVFVQPLSVLGSRDGTIVRDLVGSALESIWIPETQLFDAAVHVCAPVLRKPIDAPEGNVPPLWTELAADAMGVPSIHLEGAPLSTVANCTAGFRQEFYEVAAAVVEQGSVDESVSIAPEPVTVGLIDPARLLWGEQDARLAGSTFARPVVDVSKLSRSHELRRMPKVLVATQTRVLEAVADHEGALWPSVPVISAIPHPGVDLGIDLLLAAFLAPPASVWAARRAAGTARSPKAIRVSATLLESMPLPVDRELWERGAAQLRDGALARAARTLTAAHGLTGAAADAVMDWWEPRSVRRGQGGRRV